MEFLRGLMLEQSTNRKILERLDKHPNRNLFDIHMGVVEISPTIDHRVHESGEGALCFYLSYFLVGRKEIPAITSCTN